VQSRTIYRRWIRWWAVWGDAAVAISSLWLAREIRLSLPLPFTISRLPARNFRPSLSVFATAVVVQLLAMSILGFST